MHIYLNKAIDSNEANFTRTEATVTNGEATITRRIYFEADSKTEDAVTVTEMQTFPQKYSAHPNHPAFKYYGNATIKPISEGSRIWVAELEYSTTNPNGTDVDGTAVTSSTPPWRLKPDNISFSYPEQKVAFTASYNSSGKLYDENGDAVLPVRNSAGDVLAAERNLHNIQMTFAFDTKDWKVSHALTYGNTINAKAITVCGLGIPQYSAVMLPPECEYITVYKENSTSVKWRYWHVKINILIDTSGGLVLYRKMLDVGNRAKFAAIDVSGDEMIQACGSSVSSTWKTLPATTKPSQICHFRLMKAAGTIKGKTSFVPMGKLIFCSWEQFLYMRTVYLYASWQLQNDSKMNGLYELNCEQDENMPLNGSGYLYTKAIEGCSDFVSGTPYKTKTFREYPVKSWSGMDLPTKGIKW